jgi:hypothetical protein
MALSKIDTANMIDNVNLASGPVTGTLPAANGGTGETSFTSAGLVLLSTTSVANASSVTINPPFSSTYTSYRIIISGISVETTNQDLYFTFLDSSGTEKTSDYRYTIGGYRGSTDSAEGSESGTNCKWGRNAHNDDGTINADIVITTPQQSMRTSVIGVTNKRFSSDATSYAELFGCWMNTTNSFTQIKFFPASGNWQASGTIMVYGQKNG